MNKKILILLLSGILLCLGGCGNNELENRSFPLAVGMETADEESRMVFNFPVLSEIANENADGSYMSTASMTGKDFFTIENNYAKSDSKTIDFSHCKALVIGENFFEDEKKMDALVSYLQNQNRVARNTYLFITKLPMEELFAMDENLEKPLGTYLEELLESDESLKNKQIMTLGKYMDEQKNRKEIIYIPVIGNQNDSPAVTGAYVVRYGKALGETDTRMALASAFVEGKLEGFRGHVVDVCYTFKIKLSDYKRVISMADTKVHGEFHFAGSHFVTFDRSALPYEQVITWFKAPEKEDTEIVSEQDGSGFQLNDLQTMKISDAIAERGHDYYRENRVRYISLDKTHVQAIVEGTQPYELECDYIDGEIRNLVCDCFCTYACKHMFAAMLQLKETLTFIEKHYPGRFEESRYFAAVCKETLLNTAMAGRETGSIML